MRRLCTTTALTALTALSLAAVPAPAGAAAVGEQVERRAPAKYPENLPGCRPACARGRTIPRRWVLLSRTVTLAAGERRATVRFRCPRGRTFRTVGFLESGEILVQIPRDQTPYVRRTRLRVLAERILTPVGQRAGGTLYAVCAPR
jgi:hypothetical protein